MDKIGDAIGRGACAIIGGFVPQCQTGQSVAVLGYTVMCIIAVVLTTLILTRRAS
jgi:hypothetical protein